jgi:hypothetical protein
MVLSGRLECRCKLLAAEGESLCGLDLDPAQIGRHVFARPFVLRAVAKEHAQTRLPCAAGTSLARPRLAEILQMLQCDIGYRGDGLLDAEVDQLV